MRVKLKSILKSSYSNFECFEDLQIMFRSGNMLCVKQPGKNDCELIIYLTKQLHHLFSFKPATNKKGVYTAERTANALEIAHYNLRSQRRSIPLEDSPFFAEVEKIELLVDECDNNIVYGAAKSKDNACVFLIDINKAKVLSMGFMPAFEDIKVDSRENLTLSVSGFNGTCNYVKSLRYGTGGWEIEEQLFKRPHNQPVVQHEILFGGRTLIATRSAFYIFQDVELVQTVGVEGHIEEVIKIPRGLLVRLSNHSVKVFVEDSDEVKMVSKGGISLELQEGDEVSKMQMTHSNEEVILRTVKNFVYIWRCQHIGLEAGHKQLTFMKVESSCTSEKQGNISLSTGKKYCMLSGGRVVTLWSVERNQFVLSSQFVNAAEPQKKTILACALNPDGNSFMLAFEDRIKIFKILLNKFKYYAEFPIKRCQNIVYSHGGQLAACRYGRGVNACLSIINMLRLVEMGTLKIQAEPLQIVWNELDDELIVSTENNSLQYFRVADNTRTYTLKFDTPITHVRIDYKMRRVLVSSEDKITVVDAGKIIEVIQSPISNFDYVFPLYGIYLYASKEGVLYVGHNLHQANQQIPLFTQSRFHLVCRNGYLLAYSSFEDVAILQCMRGSLGNNRASGDQIVLIQKDEVVGLIDKVKSLETNFQLLQTATQVKLEEQRNNYQQSLSTFRDRFAKEINFANGKFTGMAMEKIKQEREAEKIFEELQHGQNTSVSDLEKMYQRKLTIQREKKMNMEQLALEQKLKYEKIICDLEAKYHREVSEVRDLYRTKMRDEAMKADKLKENKLQETAKMEVKLLDLEEENEFALAALQQEKDTVIAGLKADFDYLNQQNKKLSICTQMQEKELQGLRKEAEEKARDLRRLNNKVQELTNRIRMQEIESAKQISTIEDKNQLLTQQAHQIGQLEKAKYVLSFRTTEIRKELQPREALADKLKAQIGKLDGEFKEEKRVNFQLRQQVEKLRKINEISKQECSQFRLSAKQWQRVHDELCSEIFVVVNTMDPKEWNAALVKIYQSYIKEDRHKSKRNKKKDDSSEEINRHLIHVQQSLLQLTSGNDKLLKGREKDVMRKMKENAQLVLELNLMRKKEKDLQREKHQLSSQLEQLRIELNDSNRNSTRAHTAKTGLTRRVAASREGLSKDRSTLLDLNEFDSVREMDMRSRNKERSRISSAHKTMMFRQNMKREQSGKLFDIAKQLQHARDTIKKQGLIIEELNQRMFALPELPAPL